MPFCKKKEEEPPKIPQYTSQKIVIPRGMINPHETTIIEIPARLHDQPLVIAKRKPNGPSFTSEKYKKYPAYDEDAMPNVEEQIISSSRRPQQRLMPIDNYAQFAPDNYSSFREVQSASK